MKLVSVKELLPGMVLAQDVYLEENPSTAYLRRGFVLTDKAIERLHSRRVRRVHIEDEKPSAPQAFTPLYPKRVSPGAPAESAPVTYTPKPPVFSHDALGQPRRANVMPPVLHVAHATILAPRPTIDEDLREEAIQSLENTFDEILISDSGIYGTPESLAPLDEVVSRLVRTVVFDKRTLVNINDLKSFDEYTYHHSLSVAVLSIAIGRQMGFSTNQLNKLGMAAMMHDIGKTAVPQELIKKPGRLDKREYGLVQEHAKAGTGYLMGSSVGDEKLWRAVLGHHEKMDGTGYPLGLKGNVIPMWSRIISVADVYDALTSARPYRMPMQPADALEYVMGGIGSSFDYDAVQALMVKVDLYPVGSSVELSNGELALVLDNENTMRPIVEILGRGDVVDLFRDRQYLSVVVRRTVPPQELLLSKE